MSENKGEVGGASGSRGTLNFPTTSRCANGKAHAVASECDRSGANGKLDEKIRITAPYREQLTIQSYEQKPRIAGVQVIDLANHTEEGGDFCEVGRWLPDGALESLPCFHPVQLSYSYMEPGAIKAWHLHLRQDDLWFVPPADRLLVGLLDVREDSAT